MGTICCINSAIGGAIVIVEVMAYIDAGEARVPCKIERRRSSCHRHRPHGSSAINRNSIDVFARLGVVNILIVHRHITSGVVACVTGDALLGSVVVGVGDWRVIAAVDGDGQSAARRAAPAITDAVVEDLAEGLTGLQSVDGGVRIIDDITVAAVGLHRQGAVFADNRARRAACHVRRAAFITGADLGDGQGISISIGIVAQHVAAAVDRSNTEPLFNRIAAGIRIGNRCNIGIHQRIECAVDPVGR